MDRRPGLQREVLASLALVMGLATLVLVGLIVVHHERTLRATLGPALLAEARAGAFGEPALRGHALVGARRGRPLRALAPGRPRARRGDAPARGARRARRERRCSSSAASATRSASRRRSARAAASRWRSCRRPTSHALRRDPLLVIGLLGAADLAVFSMFAALVLRRRVVQPLQELAAAARAVGRGEAARAPVGGPRETAEVARAWNEMTEALEKRTDDLAKAVAELRQRERASCAARGRGSIARSGWPWWAGWPRASRTRSAIRSAPCWPSSSWRRAIRASREASRSHLERAAREGGRVRTILRQLLDFSRPARPAPVPLELAAVLEEARELVAAQHGHRGIRFETAARRRRRRWRGPTRAPCSRSC